MKTANLIRALLLGATLSAPLAATVQALLIALPLGIWLRALWLDRAVVPTLFISATLGFGTLFILGWRLIYGVWRVRAARRLEPAGVSQ